MDELPDKICEECKKEDESVRSNLITIGYKICDSCKISKTILAKGPFKNLAFLSTILLSHEVYREIRVYNDSYSEKSYFSSLGVHIDHATITNDYIQFVISDHDMQKLNANNLSYSIIHENVEEFYQSRLIQDYSYRDFDYGSMGGYYTFEEIEEHLDELRL